MSGAVTAIATAATFAVPALAETGLLQAALLTTQRSIRPTGTGSAVSSIIPDVTIEEQHTDRLQVTQHPVAYGSPISDHAYKLPASLTMRMGWTNANPIGSFVSGVIGGGIAGGLSGLWSAFTETRAKEVYDTLRALQGVNLGEPPMILDIQTGKRKYTNMLLTELGVRTDHTTEYSLMIEAQFQEVFIVQSSSTTQPETAMKDKVSATQDAGTRQPDPAPVDRSSPMQKFLGPGANASKPGAPPLIPRRDE